jgi:hypothetical protein
MRPVSPDGKLVVGLRAPGDASLYPIGGGKEIPIAGLHPQEVPFQWSADGRSLYVRKRGESPNQVWLLDPSTGARRLWGEISPPEVASSIPRVLISGDGKSYIYGFQRALSELYVIEGLR